MSGTLAALIVPGASKSTQLREHCDRLIVKLQDPYFRALLMHLISSNWSDVLEEETLPLHERLALDAPPGRPFERTVLDSDCGCSDIQLGTPS